jgi:orotate phosphoribosyltransferase
MIDETRKKQIKEQGLLILAGYGQPEFTDSFQTYTSGKIGPYFIQCGSIIENPFDYETAMNSMLDLIKSTVDYSDYDAISGGETRDWLFSLPLALSLKKPHIMLYKNREPIGAKIRKKTLIHIADLNNEGRSIENWNKIIEQNGGMISHAFFYVDRLEKGTEVIKNLGIQSRSVVEMDKDAWKFLADNKKITHANLIEVMQRNEDEKAWAHNKLKTHIGKLESMLRNPKEKPKAERILNQGYPEIKDELLQLIEEKKKYNA